MPVRCDVFFLLLSVMGGFVGSCDVGLPSSDLRAAWGAGEWEKEVFMLVIQSPGLKGFDYF